jgi:hypothetical protein
LLRSMVYGDSKRMKLVDDLEAFLKIVIFWVTLALGLSTSTASKQPQTIESAKKFSYERFSVQDSSLSTFKCRNNVLIIRNMQVFCL